VDSAHPLSTPLLSATSEFRPRCGYLVLVSRGANWEYLSLSQPTTLLHYLAKGWVNGGHEC
jgi:hypothetical protein